MPKTFTNFFFWAAIMDFLIDLKYYIFLFLIFFSLFRWFSFSFVLKIYSTLKMFLLNVQSNFYIELICRKACTKRNLAWISCLWLVSRLPKSNIFFFFFVENLLWSKFSNYFQAEIILWSPMFLDFLTAFYTAQKNQESCESWLIRFSVRRHSKNSKIKPKIFFCFWAALMDLLYTLKY